jgi:hypothetical protein
VERERNELLFIGKLGAKTGLRKVRVVSLVKMVKGAKEKEWFPEAESMATVSKIAQNLNDLRQPRTRTIIISTSVQNAQTGPQEFD